MKASTIINFLLKTNDNKNKTLILENFSGYKDY